ncbi:hypothetical protein C8J57DRAFT_1612103 [Mycena rebaudengoi]|nr:hypothetical protein C8J57DRAFT_1612103 [Mycena rebaudengoi]
MSRLLCSWWFPRARHQSSSYIPETAIALSTMVSKPFGSFSHFPRPAESIAVIKRGTKLCSASKRAKSWVNQLLIWAYAFACTSRGAVQRGRNPATDQHLITASLFVSLSTNILGTGLMALKGWKHARLMEHSSFAKWKGEVICILLRLVETGVISAAIQLLTCILLQMDKVALTPFDVATAVVQKFEIYLA